KEAAARFTVLGLLAVCLILLAIFGIWLIGQLTGEDNPDDPSLESDPAVTTGSSEGAAAETLPPEELEVTVGRYIYEMLSNKILTLYYEDFSIDITAADANASFDLEELKTYLSGKGIDPSNADAYIALGNSTERALDSAYIRGAVYSLNDMINRSHVQGYTVDDKVVTVYKADEIISVDVDATCEKIGAAVNGDSYGRLEADVTVDKSGEPNWEEISQRVNIEAKNAEYVYNEETKRSELVPEEVGYALDVEQMRAAYLAGSEKVLTFTAEEVIPEITVENITEKLFPDELTYYKTWYNVNDESRTNNLELAASAINGEVVLPGQKFSFNTIVGERTPERGYTKAPIYTSQGMSDDYGGGICQVVSTLYCALLYEDFDIVQRREHGYTVSYVDLGKDATVSYGWIDFVFRNNFENPILVTTETSGGYLYVRIYGIKVDQIDVYIRHETLETMDPEIKIVKDETLEPEEYRLESKGKKGYVIETYMAVYKNGEYLGERLLHTSTYHPMNGEAKVGVNWTESSETAETTATSETTTSTSATTSGTTASTPPEVTESETTTETTEASSEEPPETIENAA
ncbi:MAG: VanW family protein, partial [Clostridia bacterium]|nr:VanW family protein [Clostridia bacterium]